MRVWYQILHLHHAMIKLIPWMIWLIYCEETKPSWDANGGYGATQTTLQVSICAQPAGDTSTALHSLPSPACYYSLTAMHDAWDLRTIVGLSHVNACFSSSRKPTPAFPHLLLPLWIILYSWKYNGVASPSLHPCELLSFLGRGSMCSQLLRGWLIKRLMHRHIY